MSDCGSSCITLAAASAPRVTSSTAAFWRPVRPLEAGGGTATGAMLPGVGGLVFTARSLIAHPGADLVGELVRVLVGDLLQRAALVGHDRLELARRLAH